LQQPKTATNGFDSLSASKPQ